MTRRILAFLFVGLAAAGVARERGQSTGSAIAPRVTIQDAAGAITACFTNGQPQSSQPLQPGDALELHFTAGTVNACAMLPSEDGFALAGEWSCAVDGPIVRLTYSGPPRDWPATGLACATIDWTRPARPSAVLVEARPLRNGTMAPAEPASVPMVGAPAGGGGGAGRAVQVFSTGQVATFYGDPPLAVPGLSATINVREGSALLAHLNAGIHLECGNDLHLDLVILLDGVVVARRAGALSDSGFHAGGEQLWENWSWLSNSLAAGTHSVEIAILMDEDYSPTTSMTACIGHADARKRSSLIVLEVPAAD